MPKIAMLSTGLIPDVDPLKSCLMKIDDGSFEGKSLSLRACWLVGSSVLAPILSARKSRPMQARPFRFENFRLEFLREDQSGCGKRGCSSWYLFSINPSEPPWEGTFVVKCGILNWYL